MLRDNFGGLRAPMPYFEGVYWYLTLPLSDTISPWIFGVQKTVSIHNVASSNNIANVN